MRAILDDNAPLPETWGNSQAAGMNVYRSNYRHALMSTLEGVYDRTKAYVGDGPFRQAGIDHAIRNPSTSWTLDDAGAGFADTCENLFGDNPEVAELAWLEWALHDLATASDAEPLSQAAFAETGSGFGDEDWMGLALNFGPRCAARVVTHDLDAIWRSLDDANANTIPVSKGEFGCIAWRERERPTFLIVEADNARAFEAMRRGSSYGEVIAILAGDHPDDAAAHEAAMQAGTYLGHWLAEGIIIGLRNQG